MYSKLSDTQLKLSKIKAIKNEQGILEINGELTNSDNDASVTEAAVTIKLYDEMGQNIGGFSVLAQNEPDSEKPSFHLNTNLSVEKVSRYSLQWNVHSN